MTKRPAEFTDAVGVRIHRSPYNLRRSIRPYLQENAAASSSPPLAEDVAVSMLADLLRPMSMTPRPDLSSSRKKQKLRHRSENSRPAIQIPSQGSGWVAADVDAGASSLRAPSASKFTFAFPISPCSRSQSSFPTTPSFADHSQCSPSKAPSQHMHQPAQLLAAATKKSGHRGGKNKCGNDKKKKKGVSLVLHRTIPRLRIFVNDEFSMVDHSNPSSTGWSGREPPQRTKAEIRKLWQSGEIKKTVGQHFSPIPYVESQAMILMDNSERILLFRSWANAFMKGEKQEQLHARNIALLESTISNPQVQQDCRSGQRGEHYPLIIGHQRQYGARPSLSKWHQDHSDAVAEYLDDPVVKSVIEQASEMVEAFFPGVAERFKHVAAWHAEKYGIKPLFGLFFNYCINMCFPGQKRVHCKPHADSKNIVGVCCLFIYEIPGAKFNHKMRTWLVIWEAGVVIELPPWVYVLYPSALLFHFNIDVHDIEFLQAPAGERPTRLNTTPLISEDECGRGSLVLFNQSSMYQSAETGYSTLSAARKAGHIGKVDFGTCAQTAFENEAIKIKRDAL